MTVAMVLMETPAIIMAVVLASTLRHAASAGAVLPGSGGAATLALGAGGGAGSSPVLEPVESTASVVPAPVPVLASVVAVPGPATAARRCGRCCMSRSPTARTCCCWGRW